MDERKVIAQWLHLSDLHVFEEADTTLILEDYEKLAKEFHPDFIVITGDFRHKKYKTTFEKTKIFLDEILRIFNVRKKDVFLVPGNHDVNDYIGRSDAIKKIKSTSQSNYNTYYKYTNEGEITLYSAFEEYNEFVKNFYKNSGVDDERIINPSSCFNICWENKINLFHINTALISDGKRHKEIVDVNAIAKCRLNSSCPTIILAHHGIESLYDQHKTRIKKIIGNKKISAYLHGDIHKYNSEPVHPCFLTNGSIPQISCGKSAPQSNDNYSDVGVVTYTWYNDNNTYVDAYRWEINKEFVIDNIYKAKLNKSYDFPMIFSNISNETISNKNSSPRILEEPYNLSEYTDRISVEASKNDKLSLLTEAILEQVDWESSKPKKTLDKLEHICDMIINSKSKYPLIIKGEPGTGKSTLLSNIYIKLKENPFLNCELIDLHFYDDNSIIDSDLHLAKKIDKISNLVISNNKIIIFIDGIDRYQRTNRKYQKILQNNISEWAKNKHVKFVFSMGDLAANQFPPFLYSDIKFPKNIQTELILHPINANDSSFHSLVEKTLVTFGILENKKRKTDKANQLKDQFITHCKKTSGNKSDFRTLIFIIDRYEEYGSAIFTEKVGILFWNYFTPKISPDKMPVIGKNLAEFMLNGCNLNNTQPQSGYLYKSPVIRDFFFSWYYIYLIDKCLVDELKSFDCIFTASINRFCVDLMSRTTAFELSIVRNLIKAYDSLSLKGKNQAIYLIGRVQSTQSKKIAEPFLLNLYSEMKDQFVDFKSDDEKMMMFRSIGISLLNIGNTIIADDFYIRLIYDEKLRQINRNFHIIYYLSDSYKISTDFELNDSILSTPDNINHLYSSLYHSIKTSSKRELQYVSIITLINLVIYNHYKNKINFVDVSLPEGFCELLNDLLENSKSSNNVVRKYITITKEHLMQPNIYADTFSKIYALKRTRRAGWYKSGREINKTEQPESVAEHIWGCCMIAQLFLTENLNNCHFFKKSEVDTYSKQYSKEHIISLLLIHDLPEAYTGDIPDDPNKKEKEEQVMESLPALNSFPFFYSFGDIKALWDEYEKRETINAKIAYDIDKLEPLIQLFIYKDILVTESKFDERNSWMQKAQEQILTDFGRGIYKFLTTYLLSDDVF